MSDTLSKRKCLSSQTRETIAKVYSFLKRDAKEIIKLASDPQLTSVQTSPVLISMLAEHLNCVLKRTAEAVGVSGRTVTNILAEGREPGGKFKSPYKNRKKRTKKIKSDSSNVINHSIVKDYHLENQLTKNQ